MPFLHLHRRSAFREPSSSSSTSSSSSSSSSSGSGLPSFSLAYDASGSADACLFSAPSTYYAAALTVGEIIYNDPDGLFEAADGYYSDGGDWWQMSAGLISATGSCPSPSSSSSSSPSSSSSSPPSSSSSSSSSSSPSSSSSSSSSGSPLPSFSLAYDASGSVDACLFSFPSTYYASSLAVSAVIYNDASGTSIAADGYYSDGVNFWVQTTGLIWSTGSC